MAVGQLLASRLGELLVQDGRLTPPQLEAARSRARLTSVRLEEALLEVGVISEADLLRFLAMQHRTRFVSTERLARAEIDLNTLDRVPQRVAEHALVFPVLFDAGAGVLSVVTPDPDDTLTLGELARSGVRDVRAFVARPNAVRAAIARAYRGNTKAFDALLAQPEPVHAPSDWNAPRPAVLPQPQAPQIPSLAPSAGPPLGGARGPLPAASSAGRRTEQALPPNVQRRLTFSHDLDAIPTREITGVPQRNRPSAPGDLPPVNPPPGGSPWGNAPAAAWPAPAPPPPPRGLDPRRATGTGSARTDTRHPATEPVSIPVGSFLETLNIVVTMLEADRGDLRGHSADTARLGRQIAERVGLAVNDVDDIVTACFIHDFGKIGPRHLTAYHAAEDMAVRVTCDRAWSAPRRLLEAAGLRPLVLAAVDEMYERFDGTGIPEKKRSKDIPIGARILALVDSYSDLTRNTKNSLKRALTASEACAALAKHRGTVFDPSLLDLLTQTVSGEDTTTRGANRRHSVLIVDADPEETLVVEMRLVQQGFAVKVARSVDAAMGILLGDDEIDIVVSELELGAGGNGFDLLEQARRNTKTRDLPWVVLTSRDQGQETERAFDLGVLDFILKPPNVNVLVAKLRQAAEHRRPTQASNRVSGPGAPTGVSGSLSDMGLPELIQILWQGRKSGTLTVRSGAQFGEIVFVDGQIYDAVWGKYRKEPAVYALISLTEGDFQLTTGGTPPERVIEGSPEMLLLEAMRRLDEGLAPDAEG